MKNSHHGHTLDADLGPYDLSDSREMRLLLAGRLSPSLVDTYRERAELLAVLGPDRLGYASSTRTNPDGSPLWQLAIMANHASHHGP